MTRSCTHACIMPWHTGLMVICSWHTDHSGHSGWQMCTSAEHLPHSSDRLQSFHQNLNLAAVVSILGCLQAAFIFYKHWRVRDVHRVCCLTFDLVIHWHHVNTYTWREIEINTKVNIAQVNKQLNLIIIFSNLSNISKCMFPGIQCIIDLQFLKIFC